MVIAPPIRFSVVDFSENRRNHVKVSTSLGLLLAHLGFLRRPVDLLLQERYTTCSSLLPPYCVFSCIHERIRTHTHIQILSYHRTGFFSILYHLGLRYWSVLFNSRIPVFTTAQVNMTMLRCTNRCDVPRIWLSLAVMNLTSIWLTLIVINPAIMTYLV